MLFLLNSVWGQTTFTFWENNSNDEFPLGIYENEQEEFFVAIVINQELEFSHSKIIKLNKYGVLLDSVVIINQGCKCFIDNLIKGQDSTFIGLGVNYCDTLFYLWFVEFDLNLNILQNINIPINDRIISNIYTEKLNGECLINTFTVGSLGNTSICFVKTELSGNVTQIDYIDEGGQLNIVNEFLIDSNRSQYKVFSFNPLNRAPCFVNNLSYGYQLLSSELLDINLLNGNTAQFFDSTRYFLSGMYLSSNSGEIDFSINNINCHDSILSQKIFGLSNSYEFLSKENLHYKSPNNLFLVGTSHITVGNLMFSENPTQIMIYILDTTLNIINNNLIGGDACYLVLRSYSTRDGGYIISSSRYDHETQEYERDSYIIKVDSLGLLTAISQIDTIHRSIIKIFPNPGKDNVKIDNFIKSTEIRFYSCTGKLVLEKELLEETEIINTSDFSNGLYIYKITYDDNIIDTGKWIKMK